MPFERPEFNRYYFGDYYEPEFGRLGFVPWYDYRMGRNIPDPLFSYARWNSRADTKWEANLRGINKGRLAGNVARPSRDLIVPLNKVEHKQFKLQPVAKTSAVVEHKAAQQIRATSQERQQREAKIVAQGVHPTKPNDAPARVKVERPNVSAPRVIHAQAPAAPAVPKHVERPLPKHEPARPVHVNPPPHKEKGKGKSASLQPREVPAFVDKHNASAYAPAQLITLYYENQFHAQPRRLL